MCPGDVPMCCCWCSGNGAFKCWYYENGTGLGQVPEPDHPSYLFCYQTGQTHSVGGLWTFLIVKNSHFILNALLSYIEIFMLTAYLFKDLSPVSSLCLVFAFKKKIIPPCWGKENTTFLLSLFKILPWEFNLGNGNPQKSDLLYVLSCVCSPELVTRIWVIPITSGPIRYFFMWFAGNSPTGKFHYLP